MGKCFIIRPYFVFPLRCLLLKASAGRDVLCPKNARNEKTKSEHLGPVKNEDRARVKAQSDYLAHSKNVARLSKQALLQLVGNHTENVVLTPRPLQVFVGMCQIDRPPPATSCIVDFIRSAIVIKNCEDLLRAIAKLRAVIESKKSPLKELIGSFQNQSKNIAKLT